MIQIRKGHNTLTVTQGAYNSYYKHLGYEPVGMATCHENTECENAQPPSDSQFCGDPTQPEKPEEGEDEEFTGTDAEGDGEIDLSEIPLREMDFDQLCEYADQLGLNHDGIRKKSEMRALIREHVT